jgi:hypothetical protein
MNFKEGFNICGIDHTSDSDYPREDVDYPTLLGVVAEGLFQGGYMLAVCA